MGKPLAGRTILVVEDEPVISLELRELLERQGAAVVAAPTVTVAHGLIAHRKLSAAVIDFWLHAESCRSVIAALRARGVPALIVTGLTLDDELPADIPVVTKPFREDDLVAAVVALCAAAPDRDRGDGDDA